MFGQNVNQQVADSMIEETEQRWDGQPRDSDGRFDKGKRRRLVRSGAKRKTSEKSSKRLEKSDKSAIIMMETEIRLSRFPITTTEIRKNTLMGKMVNTLTSIFTMKMEIS